MSLRREQGLLIVVAALGVWMWSSSNTTAAPRNPTVRELSYEPPGVPVDPLAAPVTVDAPLGRDPFREPSESAPLEPTVLAFPELGPLPMVAVPQPIGQTPAYYHQLRIDGELQPFSFGDSNDVGGSDSVGEASAGGSNGDAEGEGAQVDKIKLMDGRILEGFIRQPDKFTLVGKRTFTEPIVYDWVGRDGRIIRTNERHEPGEIQSIELADTLRNRVELRRRQIGPGEASLPARREFVTELLHSAEREPWLYEVAESLAREFIAQTDGREDGYRMLLRVLRARGDVSGEWQVLQELPAPDRSFALTARGDFEGRLGLDRDAEDHLRRAVELESSDPRARVALARYLLDRGRANEALEHADAAKRNRAVLATDEEVYDVLEVLVRARLALGEHDQARRDLGALPVGEAFGARRDTLFGAVEYAARNWEAARRRFASARAAGAGGPAGLGLGCALVALGEWQDARTALESVAERYPLVRHLAYAGLGLLYLRTDNLEDARSALQNAERAAPDDPYIEYLVGRVMRGSGLDEGAVDALTKALEHSDGFIEVHAEIARARLALAEQGGDAVAAMVEGRRHADRAVELDAEAGQSVRLRELQGIVRFWAGDPRAARAVFEAIADQSLLARIGLALVEYRLNHVQDARGLLLELRDELRSGEPMRGFADATIAVIDDHAEKEQVLDGFDREDLGRNWHGEPNGAVTPDPDGEVLRVQGRLSRPGVPVFASREVTSAGNLISAEVDVVLGANDQSRVTGLEIATKASGAARGDFQARLGMRDGKPYLLIADGEVARATPDNQANWDPVQLPGLTVRRGERVRLMLAVAPRDADKFVLQAYWDEVLVHEREVERLRRRTRVPLAVSLFVEGSANDRVDVTFDDFRLVRRREM